MTHTINIQKMLTDLTVGAKTFISMSKLHRGIAVTATDPEQYSQAITSAYHSIGVAISHRMLAMRYQMTETRDGADIHADIKHLEDIAEAQAKAARTLGLTNEALIYQGAADGYGHIAEAIYINEWQEDEQ